MATLKELAQTLAGESRAERQKAAAEIAKLAQSDPNGVVKIGDNLVDALNRPEARTRWECLDALTYIVVIDSRLCDKALLGAESALFDEDSGPLHLSAMRFLCKLGATTEARSKKAWPLIDEGIQCYHGDVEFEDMLNAIIEFAHGKIHPEVKEALKARMTFDAENPKGVIGKRAQLIVSIL